LSKRLHTLLIFLCCLGAVLPCAIAHAAEPVADAARAQQNYTLNCQGCHLADAAGMEGRVPRLRGSVGNFLRVPGGREYLIRVPGVATTPLDNTALAELMNWLLHEFSAARLPPDFKPYTAEEVGVLRRRPLADVETERAKLLERIGRQGGQ
jgi:hypothetical protein